MLSDILIQAIRISIPYILASLAGLFSEKSGVINIALEGILLWSALATILGIWYTDNIAIGIFSAICLGVFFSSILLLFTSILSSNHIIVGLSLNMLALGSTRLVLKSVFNSASNTPRVDGLERYMNTADNSSIEGLLTNPAIALVAILVFISYYIIYYTPFGLHLRSVGENPLATKDAGISPLIIRLKALIISGSLVGLSGAWLALEQHQFTNGMSGGRGYMALAAVVLGKWHPIKITIGCIFFGIIESIQFNIQGSVNFIPSQFFQVLPYILCVFALITFVGKSSPPSALGSSLKY